MRIDFYIFEQMNKAESLLFTCKLIEKCYLQQEKIFIHPSSQDEAKEFDRLLWTYHEASFLPHHLDHPEANCYCPIHIGLGNLNNQFEGILFNLHQDLALPMRCTRLVEIVFFEPTMQQLARERYKTYRTAGHHLLTHKINKSDL